MKKELKEVLEQLMNIDSFRAREIMKDCSRGYQRCHECPVLGCCDNMLKHEIKKILKQKEKEEINPAPLISSTNGGF